MWYAIYNVEGGELVSLGTVVADPLPTGLSAKEVGESRPEGEWSVAALNFGPAPCASLLASQDFMGRFTVAEEAAVRQRAMTDPMLQTFLARVERARSVSMAHPDMVAGMQYLVQLGLITAERCAEILNG